MILITQCLVMDHGIPTKNVLDRNAVQFSLEILTLFFLNMAPKRKNASPSKNPVITAKRLHPGKVEGVDEGE